MLARVVAHLSKLQLPCWHAELFEEASSLLKPSDDVKQSSETLRKAIALSSNFNKIKAWKAVAAREAENTNLGIACADLQVCKALPCDLLCGCRFIVAVLRSSDQESTLRLATAVGLWT